LLCVKEDGCSGENVHRGACLPNVLSSNSWFSFKTELVV
jgi:hypothetical protein